MKAIATILDAPKKVEKVHGFFLECNLNDSHLEILLTAISKFQDLKELELDLSHNQLTIQGFTRILQLTTTLNKLVNLKIMLNANNLQSYNMETMLSGYRHNSLKHAFFNFADSSMMIQSIFVMMSHFVNATNLPELRVIEIQAPNVNVRSTDFETWFMLPNDCKVKKVIMNLSDNSTLSESQLQNIIYSFANWQRILPQQLIGVNETNTIQPETSSPNQVSF